MLLGLEDKVVVVSGATGAIGEAVCLAFLDEGATVAPLHRGGRERLAPLFERASAAGLDVDRIAPREADLTDPTSLDAGVREVLAAHGRIDVLINNAGVTLERPFLATGDEEARHVVEVNLWGSIELTRRVLKPMMLQRSGSVVTITSLVASRGGRGVSIYAASKAALETLTRTLAIEMARKGIRLNAIAPGVIETPMSRRLVRRRGDVLRERVPMKRLGRPEEVAPAALWLASDRASSYVTGQVVTVDGGLGL